MPRKKGDRNTDYEQRRAELAGRVRARLGDGDRPSLRELARAADVTLPTIVHYFGDRDGAVAAVLEGDGESGAPFLARAASAEQPFAESMAELAGYIVQGFRSGRLSAIHAIGLQEGMNAPQVGPAYLAHVLEPTLAAVETRLSGHMARGEMVDADVRAAALAFTAPLVLAGLHQRALGGDTLRPLDLTAFAAQLADGFVRAYAARAA